MERENKINYIDANVVHLATEERLKVLGMILRGPGRGCITTSSNPVDSYINYDDIDDCYVFETKAINSLHYQISKYRQ